MKGTLKRCAEQARSANLSESAHPATELPAQRASISPVDQTAPGTVGIKLSGHTIVRLREREHKWLV